MKAHLLFEQSGTFKNEFKKLGIEAFDYDILNQFSETDYVIDLFDEIDKSYGGGYSIFDNFKEDDILMAFFPCVRFENQALLLFRGENSGFKNWSIKQKLEYDLTYHQELARNYELITKLVLICIEKNLKLVIENPYSEQHYLTRYWCLKPKYIDYDRRRTGDYYKKPTQYYFINCEPKHNFIFEGIDIKIKKSIIDTRNQVERSMISKDYANRFIREMILDEETSN